MRDLINDYLDKNVVNKDDVSILFSGGMDSLSILISCLDVGIKPNLYTFYLDNYESQDLFASRKCADAFDLKLIEICMKTDVEYLINDVKSIIRCFSVYKKTAIQCIHPFLHIIPQIEEEYILTGLCADDLYGSSKHMAILSKDINEFNKKRINIMKEPTTSAYLYFDMLTMAYNKKLIAPYKQSNDIRNYFMSLSYKDMNSPKQKFITYTSYQKEIDMFNLYRRNSNLQCDSKIREYHDWLLNTDYNKNNYKIVTPIYRNIYNQIKEECT